MKAKITFKNIIRFFTGYSRYYRYLMDKHSLVLSILPSHVKEQFEERLKVMNRECLTSGKCKACGCDTPAKQMAFDGCSDGCYPNMMDRDEWEKYKNNELRND